MVEHLIYPFIIAENKFLNKINKVSMQPGKLSTKKGLVTILINERTVSVREGSNLAAVLMEQGYIGLRTSEKKMHPRGVFCGMGVCFECLVKVGGEELRACQTWVEEGMKISVSRGRNA